MHLGHKMSNLRWVALVALSLAGTAPAAAGAADRAFAALLACDARFFAVLADGKAAFGPATVSPVPDVDAETTLAIGRADFARPAEAYGLHLTGFVEMARGRGRPESFWFGFRTIEPPPVVARTIAETVKEADFEQRDDRYGWLIELEPRWHKDGDGTAIEHRYPVRMIEIAPIKTKDVVGSVVRCGLAVPKAGGMTKLPPTAELFQTQAAPAEAPP